MSIGGRRLNSAISDDDGYVSYSSILQKQQAWRNWRSRGYTVITGELAGCHYEATEVHNALIYNSRQDGCKPDGSPYDSTAAWLQGQVLKYYGTHHQTLPEPIYVFVYGSQMFLCDLDGNLLLDENGEPRLHFDGKARCRGGENSDTST